MYRATILALTNVIPVTIEHEGKTNTYPLRAEATNALQLKILNLNPSDFLAIDSVVRGSPAEKAGLQTGDQILEFAGVRISSSHQFTNLVQKYPDRPAAIVVMRRHTRVALEVTPALDPRTKVTRMGVGLGMGKDDYVLEHPTPWAQISDVLDQLAATPQRPHSFPFQRSQGQ